MNIQAPSELWIGLPVAINAAAGYGLYRYSGEFRHGVMKSLAPFLLSLTTLAALCLVRMDNDFLAWGVALMAFYGGWGMSAYEKKRTA